MVLETTVIGSFPKPEYLKTPDWFRTGHDGSFTAEYTRFMSQQQDQNQGLENSILQATKEIINIQTEIGIDIVTDGEVRRESYVLHFCRRLRGFDFHNLTSKVCRDGAVTCDVPTIRSAVESMNPEPWVHREWRTAQELSPKPVKATLPGPMTIINSVADVHYNDDVALGHVLAQLINREVKALAEAGCRYIQVDEPVMVRFPKQALTYGIDQLTKCFEGVDGDVVKCVHLCCGYPNHLDQENFEKADKNAYLKLADKLDAAGFDQISIEDSHRHNDLELFQRFKKSKLIVGSFTVASSRVETVDEIRSRLQEILSVFPAECLVVAPDCGLGHLPVELAKQKLRNMKQAADSLP